jgi:hypothetical protein
VAALLCVAEIGTIFDGGRAALLCVAEIGTNFDGELRFFA